MTEESGSLRRESSALKVVSGAQTGVDRAALDAALEAGILCGGFVPKGRLAEDGRVSERYPVQECGSEDYPVRTELNVEHSGATLILYEGELDGGTLLTRNLCRKHGKPFLAVPLDRRTLEQAVSQCLEFLRDARPKIVNMAGPRESGRPGIHDRALAVLRRLFALLQAQAAWDPPARDVS